MLERIKDVVRDSRLWDSGRTQSHGFTLSPSVYEISQKKRTELEELGEALHDCLSGIGRIAAIACSPPLSHGATWGMIAKVVRTGVPVHYHDIMLLRPGSTPSICKVDLLEAENGELRIAEIDGHNKHGLGYSTLAARMRRALMPTAAAFPGVASLIAKEVLRRGEKSVILLYADQERFYSPEFRILQAEVATHGIDMPVVREQDVCVEKGRMIANGAGDLSARLFVDLPFLYHHGTLSSLFAERYRNGEIDFLIPPKPFLGSKAVLALLRNSGDDEELEAILRSHIRQSSLDVLRRFTPNTFLVGKRMNGALAQLTSSGKRFVMKESISSGMKGTVFQDDDTFTSVLERASGSFYRAILQEEVANRPRTFLSFAADGSVREDTWYTRVTVHYAVRRVADVTVTARTDKKVHGAPDCLQLGSVITS